MTPSYLPSRAAHIISISSLPSENWYLQRYGPVPSRESKSRVTAINNPPFRFHKSNNTAHPNLKHTPGKTVKPRTSIIDLQTRISDLEARLAEAEDQLRSALSLSRNLNNSAVVDTAAAAAAASGGDARESPSANIPDADTTMASNKSKPQSPTSHMLKQAQSIVRDHINLLTRYNTIKDIGLGLMGLIAERDGKTMAEVMVDFGVEDGG